MFLVLTILSAIAFIISTKNDDGKWIAVAGIALFGGGPFAGYNFKITVQQAGFEVKNFRGTKFVAWQDITSLHFDMVYHGHGAQAELKVMIGHQTVFLYVKQSQAAPMQRFFEIVDEQCATASKNVHFRNQASEKMNWRNKLKMF